MPDVAWDPAATGANDGTSWANAYTTIAAAVTGAGAGGKIYMASTGVELLSVNLTLPTALANFPALLSVDKTSGFPPTVELAGARIGSIDANSFSVINSAYSKGVFLTAADGATANRNLTLDASSANHVFRMIGGKLQLNNSGTGSFIAFGSTAVRRYRHSLEDVELSFGHAAQGIRCNITSLSIKGGFTSGAAITQFIQSLNSATVDVRVDGLDMSSCDTGVNLLVEGTQATGSVIFSNIKMPAGWNGALMASPPAHESLYVRAYNVDSGSTNYRMLGVGFNGTLRSETTIVRTGGATDGVTPLSWRMETGTQYYPLTSLKTDPIAIWNDTVGTPITATVEIVNDGVTLKDDEVWVEFGYLDDTGTPLGAFISDEKASQLVAGANQATSSASWTTTGLTTPITQALSVTFTPEKVGYIYAIVHLARSSTVIYVDPEITVT